jgi:hypothetical protein
MKQLPMTAELSALIKSRVGEDVDTSNLAVFETIALNTKPLPGKRGTIWENAVVKPVTLAQMVDYIISGNHLPLIADHELFGAPKGRFFDAALFSDSNSLDDLEMRALFYLDETEAVTIAKLNAGSLDEVSVSFLPTAFLCSDCGFDYFSQGDMDNIDSRTCDLGHTLGSDGVHAEMVGLNQFVELSLVARGAADKPKIVGKSNSKLAPESVYRLAAKGFATDRLVLQASIKKVDDMDTTVLVTNLAEVTGKFAVSEADKARLTTELSEVKGKLTTAEADVARLTTELAAAVSAQPAKPADYDTAVAGNTAAVAFLQEQLNGLLVASGKPKLEGDALPKEVSELKASITEHTNNLTAIIPTGGVSQSGTGASTEPKVDYSNFSVRR